MNMDDIKQRIQSKLYGENVARGIMEFSWSEIKDPNEFDKRLHDAKHDCHKIGVKWVDADVTMSNIIVVTPQDHEQAVLDIMTKYGFSLVNKIFNPKPISSLGGVKPL